jgi:integrase
MVDTPEILFCKAYATIAVIMAGRGCEVGNVRVGDVSRVQDGEGGAAFHVAFERSKQLSTRSSDRELAVLTCPYGVAALDRYIDTRPRGVPTDEQKRLKFFRRIARPTAAGKLKMSWSAQNIGKGKMAEVGRDIAMALGLQDWKKYSGHCFRRTACTMAANAGMGIPQIKAMTGHKSDAVVQVSLLHITHCYSIY